MHSSPLLPILLDQNIAICARYHKLSCLIMRMKNPAPLSAALPPAPPAGMNFIAGVLLLFMGEEDAYYCLQAVVEDILPGYFSQAMVATQVRPGRRRSTVRGSVVTTLVSRWHGRHARMPQQCPGDGFACENAIDQCVVSSTSARRWTSACSSAWCPTASAT